MHLRRMLTDGVIELRLVQIVKIWWFYPSDYVYDVYLKDSGEKIGRCDYRTLDSEENYYAGNIGYLIYQQYRGNGYAYKAALLMCKFASQKHDRLWITCSPENSASYRIIERLGGILTEVVDVPKHHFLYTQGEKIKCIFNLKIKELKDE